MWAVLFVLSSVAFYVWAKSLGWKTNNISAFGLFPLLGMLAWLTMWTHYFWGAMQWRTKLYSRVTGYIVLVCILLHPAIFAYAQYKAGKGFPPLSYYRYLPPSVNWAVALGSFSFFVFISYEFFKRMKSRPWVARYWPWVSVSQAVAMFLIFIHSLKIGNNLQIGWFRIFWAVCGIILVPCAFILVSRDFSSHKHPEHRG